MIEEAVVEQLRKFRVSEADGQTLDENLFEFVRDLVKEVSYDGTTGAVSLDLRKCEANHED